MRQLFLPAYSTTSAHGSLGIRKPGKRYGCRFLGDFSDQPSAQALLKAVQRVTKRALSDKYLDASDCEEAPAALEIVAAARHQPASGLPSASQQLALSLAVESEPAYADFHYLCVRAVWFIRKESELRDLWTEAGELAQWEQVQADLLKRLG